MFLYDFFFSGFLSRKHRELLYFLFSFLRRANLTAFLPSLTLLS